MNTTFYDGHDVIKGGIHFSI